MRLIELLAFLALIVFAGIGFRRGLRTKPTRGRQGEFIAGVNSNLHTDPHGGQGSGGLGGGS